MTSDGRVWSERRRVDPIGRKSYMVGSMWLRPSFVGSGYRSVSMRARGSCETLYVHRLVAEAFIGPLEAKSEVDHIDRDLSNNCVSNLRIVSSTENKLNKDVRGCSKDAKLGGWTARIMLRRSCLYLGRYELEEDAKDVYDFAKKAFFSVFAYIREKKGDLGLAE